jgi:hypothetical protein
MGTERTNKIYGPCMCMQDTQSSFEFSIELAIMRMPIIQALQNKCYKTKKGRSETHTSETAASSARS